MAVRVPFQVDDRALDHVPHSVIDTYAERRKGRVFFTTAGRTYTVKAASEKDGRVEVLTVKSRSEPEQWRAVPQSLEEGCVYTR